MKNTSNHFKIYSAVKFSWKTSQLYLFAYLFQHFENLLQHSWIYYKNLCWKYSCKCTRESRVNVVDCGRGGGGKNGGIGCIEEDERQIHVLDSGDSRWDGEKRVAANCAVITCSIAEMG